MIYFRPIRLRVNFLKSLFLYGHYTFLSLFFFLLYTASAIVAGAKLFSTVFNFTYIQALLVGWALIMFYTLIGGFFAVCWTDFIQGSLMFVALLIVPITMFIMLGNWNEISTLLADAGPTYLKFSGSETGFNLKSIASNLAWGLGYFGMPHIVVRFMAIKTPKNSNSHV